jgi:hypothetical protein
MVGTAASSSAAADWKGANLRKVFAKRADLARIDLGEHTSG